MFDLDGVLLDTEGSYRQATSLLLGEYGVTLTNELWLECIGRSGIDVCELLVARYGLPEAPAALLERRYALVEASLRRASAMPGAQRLTTTLQSAGIPLAIATGSNHRTFEWKRTAHRDWLATFSTVVTRDDVVRGKPAPDIYLEAAHRLGINASDCVIVEDAPAGVEAACRAGATVVFVPSLPEHTTPIAADLTARSLDEEAVYRFLGLPY